MNDREKLVELIKHGRSCPDDLAPFADERCKQCRYAADVDCDISRLADHLLANGVTIREPGEWKIITDDYGNEMMECSRCGSDFYDGDNDTVDCLHNFCPNCGAPMKGESNA